MKKFVLFFLLCISINAQTTLSAGDVVIIAINGDADAANSYGRGFSFMPLVHLQVGTVINFTDYGWSDVTGAFITNTAVADVFIHYTAPTAITAGTIIRCDSYSTTNFTYDYSYSGGGQNYLNVAGLTQGDEVLVFQGDRSAPTFICAASIVDNSLVASGWATSVTKDGTDASGAGSALPGSGNATVPDLVDDVTALSFNRASDANDNCAYSGATTAATMAVWKTRVATYTNWTFNNAAPIPTPLTGPFTVTDALPVELVSFTASAFDNKINLTWQTATEVNNYGFEIERSVILSEAKNLLTRNWQNVGFVEGHGNSNSTKEYSFVDKDIIGGSYMYRLKQIDTDGSFTYSKEITVETRRGESLPTEFALFQNYPNPFNPTTKIRFSVPAVETHRDASLQHVSLKVYDILGNEVATLVNEAREPGVYEVEFNAAQLPGGIYFYRLQTDGGINMTKKFVLMK